MNRWNLHCGLSLIGGAKSAAELIPTGTHRAQLAQRERGVEYLRVEIFPDHAVLDGTRLVETLLGVLESKQVRSAFDESDEQGFAALERYCGADYPPIREFIAGSRARWAERVKRQGYTEPWYPIS